MPRRLALALLLAFTLCAPTAADSVTYPVYPAMIVRLPDGRMAVAVAGPPDAARWCAVVADPAATVCAAAQPVVVQAAAGAQIIVYLFDADLTYLGCGATLSALQPIWITYLPEVAR